VGLKSGRHVGTTRGGRADCADLMPVDRLLHPFVADLRGPLTGAGGPVSASVSMQPI
jgi:hypothetical protein